MPILLARGHGRGLSHGIPWLGAPEGWKPMSETTKQTGGVGVGPPPTPRHTGIKAMVKDLGTDVKHLPSRENLFWVAVGGGLALAVHPADDNVNHALVGSDFAKAFFKPGAVLGELPTPFPSGHAADTFAFATALERHLGWKGAVPAYIFSSYVAISRLPANRHWFSDAVFGSAVGIIAGRTVTRHGREFPVTVMPLPGGVAITYVHHSSN
jgi:hypothetical protein